MYLRRDCFLLLMIAGIALTANCATAEKIRVASSSPSLTARLPHFVAHEEGFFTREGLQVESIVVRNDATILAALAAGEFDYVETGAPPAVAGISKGLPFVIIGGVRVRLFFFFFGGERHFVHERSEGLEDRGDRGRRIIRSGRHRRNEETRLPER